MKDKVEVLVGSGDPTSFLRSVNHIRVIDECVNWKRSVIVGLQFAVIHFPGEILKIVIAPFVVNIILAICELFNSLALVIIGAVSALISGFSGHLEATKSVEIVTQSVDATE